MTSSFKQPPGFNPNGGDSYADWKNDIEIWKLFTKEDTKRQGPAVYLTLQGDARDAIRAMDKDDIAKENGVDLIIQELDKVYLKDETTRAFCAFKEFVEYRRQSGVSFSKFIVEWNQKYGEVKKHKLDLVDGVKGYFLLVAANLTSEHERLVRATAKLEFDDIKEKLQRVFGEFGDTLAADGTQEGSMPVKTEESLYTNNYYRRNNRGRGRGGSSYRGGRGRGGSNRSDSNPKNVDGEIMKCYDCESTKHLIGDCPHKKKQEEAAEYTVHVSLITATDQTGKRSIISLVGKGILDTGCTKMVAGKAWMDEFMHMLSEEDKEKMVSSSRESRHLYRFGDGHEDKSMQEIDIPLLICGKRIVVPCDVVKSDVPLLISRPFMSKLGMLIDTKKHTVSVDGKTHTMATNMAGHYVIPVHEKADCNMVFHLEHLSKYSLKQKKEKALKLHRQFAHASKERLIKLLKAGGCEDTEFVRAVEECCDQCVFCNKYRQPKPRPIVGMPKAQRFNEVIAMDLKEVIKGKLWILHVVDLATRYTVAVLIESKETKVIMKNLMKSWFSYFGSPKRIHSDCGGEFSSNLFREMNERFGIETSTTPAEAPYANGVVERGNKVLFESMMKTKEDVGCDTETALAWAVSAKNYLQNVYGFSPNQLVLSQNVTLPNVIDSEPPALESHTSCDLVRQNLNAMHSAREQFVKAESSDKIKRALLKNVRTYSEVDFQSGEKVYFRRKNLKGWKGPGKVLGKEGNFVLIRYGAAYYRCHPCDLMKALPSNVQKKESVDVSAGVLKKPEDKCTVDPILLDDSSSSDEEDPEENQVSDVNEIQENQNEEVGESDQKEMEVTQQENVDVVLENNPVEDEENTEDPQEVVDEPENVEENAENIENSRLENEINENIMEEELGEEVTSEISDVQAPRTNESAICNGEKFPKKRTVVQYATTDNNIQKAEILSSQPKRTGQHGKWVNVRILGSDEATSVDWQTVVWWKTVTETVNQILVLNDVDMHSQEVVDAKEAEVQNLIENDVFQKVPYTGQSTVSCRWVIEDKSDGKAGRRIKARLVARGFEEDLMNKKVDSPTCSRQALRLVISTASTYQWEISSLDIKSAFLQGKEITRDVFIMPPKDIRVPNEIWKLKRCLYGLNDAPREWYNKLSERLTALGGQVSLYDKALFMWHKDEQLIGVMTTHVDDLIYSGTEEWNSTVVGKVCQEFKISKTAKKNFRYIGLEIEQNQSDIFVDQQHYIMQLEELKIDENRKKDIHAKLNMDEQKLLRSACGQLLWVTSQTRPDMAFAS